MPKRLGARAPGALLMNRLVLGAVIAAAIGLSAGLFLSMHGIDAISVSGGHAMRDFDNYWYCRLFRGRCVF